MTASILVVEDNRDNMRLMEYLLRAFGYSPQLATTGADGIRYANEQRPDLILMDIQMPEMDGYEATKAIRANPELDETRIIAVTAFAMVGDSERIMEGGFDGYISKPIGPETFGGQVEMFLAKGPRVVKETPHLARRAARARQAMRAAGGSRPSRSPAPGAAR